MLTSFDYAVLGFYLLLLIGVGVYFHRAGHNSSEYFRGGGRMSWWMVGCSGFMGAFSAWTFTGGASLAYSFGLFVLALYLTNAIGFFFNWAYFARLFRRTRVITALEAVRLRLGPVNEQVFTWLSVPFQVLQAGIWLYGLAVFCTPVFGFSVEMTLLGGGLVVVFLATAGGAWAVVAGDFIQALVLVPITLVAAYSAVQYVGGPAAFVHHMPASHWRLTAPEAGLGIWYLIALALEKLSNLNGLNYASRYLNVRDGRDARKAAALTTVLFVFGSFVWFIPPLAARISGLPLGHFEGIHNPADMSFVVIAAHCLPAGLMGLLVTGIVSSTVSAMDTGLNRNAGIFVRSFYLPVVRPHAAERELVIVGRLTTAGFGVLAIATGLLYATWANKDVFHLMMSFSSLVATPYAVPLVWCVLLKRSPDWAAWSTLIVCVAAGVTVNLLPALPAGGAGWPAWLGGLSTWARSDNGSYVAVTVSACVLGSLWYLGAAWLFPPRLSAVREQESAEFFQRIATPLTDAERPTLDIARHRGIARMCLVYAAFLVVLAVLTRSWKGAGGLLFCAAFLAAVYAGIEFALRRSAVRGD